LARNPLVLFLIAPLYVFVIHRRFSSSAASPRERRSVRRTNLALLAALLVMGSLIGVVYRQYRLPPHTSSQSAHSKLLSAAVPCEAGLT
jgi:hypothetical protein